MKVKKKICLISDHHISVNPRVWKEAFCYEKEGYEVVILVMWVSDEFRRRDLELIKGHNITYKAYLNLIPSEISKGKRLFLRIRKKIAGELVKLGIELPYAISYGPDLMTKAALKENADFYSAHLECAFLTGKKLIQKGKKVSFDFEDWYSKDYISPTRAVKLLERLEHFALIKGEFCTTTSHALATALSDYYKINKEITVIYNGFSAIDSNEVKTNHKSIINQIPKIIWFSRSVGKGRGVEKVIHAINALDYHVELHLLGDIPIAYKEELIQIFPFDKGHKLIFHSFVPHYQLVNFLSTFDIGMAVEELEVANKQLTVSNKLFQYIQAGLFVIATKTKGQMEVACHFPESIQIVEISENDQWVSAISSLVKNGQFDPSQRIEKFNTLFSWEAQEKKLLTQIHKNL